MRRVKDLGVGLTAIYAMIAAYAVWILLMPFCGPIARHALQRFHLVTPTFIGWAVQQPIPAMYNFANTFEVRQWPPREEAAATKSLLPFESPLGDEHDFGRIHLGYINHFPSRAYTFASQRIHCCSPNEDRWIVTESSFRGQRVKVLVHLDAVGNGQFEVTRKVMSNGE